MGPLLTGMKHLLFAVLFAGCVIPMAPETTPGTPAPEGDQAAADPGAAPAIAPASAEAYVDPVSGVSAPHPNEGLLAWMTGDWIGTNHQFEFHGDGTVRRSSGVALYTDTGHYGCLSLMNDIGAVYQEGDLFIMQFETSDTNHCGDRTSTEPVTVVYQIQWFDNPYDQDEVYLQLQLRELDCTRGGDMYCVDGMRRR